MIDDDRFIRESFDFWYFGKDNTGNLMDFKNLEGLLDLVSTMGDIHLVSISICIWTFLHDLYHFIIVNTDWILHWK